MRSRNIAYIPAVDHVRAFASILIVLYHCYQLISHSLRYEGPHTYEHWIDARNWLEAVLVEGHTAVAMFLVLSGFLFTHGSLDRRLAYGSFLRNRLLRIYPLFLFLIVIGMAAFPARFELLAFFQTLLGLSNMPNALQLGPISAMFWTVALESQFYLVFPFLLLFVQRDGAKPLLWLLAAAIVFRAVAVALGGNVLGLTYWSMAGRIDQFLLGMLAALFFRSSACRPRVMALALVPVLVAVAGLLAAFNAAGGWPADAGWKTLWPTVEGFAWAAFLVCYLCAAPHLPERVSRVFAAVGMVSYSTYLIHFVVLRLLLSRGWLIPFDSSPEMAALLNAIVLVLPLVLGIATISYRAVERPFLALRGTYLR